MDPEELESLRVGGDDSQLPCGCQPECEHVAYEADVSEGEFSRQLPINSPDFFGRVDDAADFSMLHVYFVDLIGTLYRRDIYYTWKQLLATEGGLLALVLGFSLVAGFELLYFASLRAVCAAWRQRSRPHPHPRPRPRPLRRVAPASQ
ncbi:hypothetical protein R5R35_003660 [Gryllus longicercus]|uniref:Uncharacterized protein n=1 Tax=Gryllus longicercus TaxID=2509291 RepID=A0AAN9VPD9_9ORTH